MVVLRMLFTLLLGFVVGAATMLYLVRSETGDLLVRRTQVVQDLERRLREVELQRDQLARSLEDVGARASRMESAFNELERRYRTLDTPRPGREEAAP